MLTLWTSSLLRPLLHVTSPSYSYHVCYVHHGSGHRPSSAPSRTPLLPHSLIRIRTRTVVLPTYSCSTIPSNVIIARRPLAARGMNCIFCAALRVKIVSSQVSSPKSDDCRRVTTYLLPSLITSCCSAQRSASAFHLLVRPIPDSESILTSKFNCNLAVQLIDSFTVY
jgi:hypothetical protein